METKKTAIEWLVEELMKTNLKISIDGLVALSTKALEMEYKQELETYHLGYDRGREDERKKYGK